MYSSKNISRRLLSTGNHYQIWNKILKYHKQSPHRVQWLECYQLRYLPKNKVENLHIARTIQEEIHLKFSHMITLFDRVPYFLAKNPRFLQIQSLYIDSFTQIYRNTQISDEKEGKKMSEILSQVKNKHQNVPIQLSRIYYHQVTNDPEIKKQWQTFLYNFYQHRMSLRLHLTHFQWLFGDNTPTVANSMMKQISIHNLTNAIIEDITSLAQLHRLHIPKIATQIQQPSNNIYYIPSHMNFILAEILKNAIWACQTKPDAHIQIQGNLSGKYWIYRIHDTGKGLTPEEVLRCFHFCETSHPSPESILDDADRSSPFYGFGHGLPLCRLYARFLGGDLYLNPRPEKGATVELILPVCP